MFHVSFSELLVAGACCAGRSHAGPFDFLWPRKLAGAKAGWFAMSSTGETKSETKSETTKKRFFQKCDWQGKHQRCSLIKIILTSHLEAGLHIWHVWNFSFDFWIFYGILWLLELPVWKILRSFFQHPLCICGEETSRMEAPIYIQWIGWTDKHQASGVLFDVKTRCLYP